VDPGRESLLCRSEAPRADLIRTETARPQSHETGGEFLYLTCDLPTTYPSEKVEPIRLIRYS